MTQRHPVGAGEHPLLTTREACALLRVSRVTLWRLRRAGLPHLVVRGRPRFDRAAVLAWLAADGGPRAAGAPRTMLPPGPYRCQGCGVVGRVPVAFAPSDLKCARCGVCPGVERA